MSIYNNELIQDLIKLGLCGDRVPVDALAKSRHFWRGYVDGDGCISPGATAVHHNLCGKPPALQKYLDFLESNGIPAKVKIVQGRGIHYVKFAGRKAANIFKLLYDEAPVYLQRKLDLAISESARYNIEIKKL